MLSSPAFAAASSWSSCAGNTERRAVAARRVRFMLAVAVAALGAACTPARSEPLEVFRHGEIEQAAERTRVRSGLLQIAIFPGVVLSTAGSGAEFGLRPIGALTAHALEVAVYSGEVRIVALRADAVYALEPGGYRVQTDADGGVAVVHEGAQARALPATDFTHRPAALLADGVLLRQQKLLQVDALDLARSVLWLFRR